MPEVKNVKKQRPWEVLFTAQVADVFFSRMENIFKQEAAGMSSPQAR